MSKPEKIISLNSIENPTEAFDRVMKGVDLLADPVRITLGPWGHNVMIEKSGGRITNDGITVARQVQARDEIEDLAVRVVREGAIKTNDEAGDGTTTATVLTQAILKEAKSRMRKKGIVGGESVMSMRSKILKESAEAIEKLNAMATPITTVEQLIEVAKVSMENESIAKIIAETQWELGKDGVIIPEETADTEWSIERVKGVRIDNGLGTSMVMNDLERQRLVLNDVPVLLTNYVVDSIAPFLESLNAIIATGKKHIVIMARGYSNQAIRDFQENQKNGIYLYPLQAPYVNQREVMKDLEAVLGGRYIHDESASLEDITSEDFGHATKIQAYRYTAILTGNKDVTERIEALKKEKEGEKSLFAKKALDARISQLQDGFALLKIGSTSDIDRKYLYDKAEDAVNTVRSALQEGTVHGAGLAFKQISDQMDEGSILKKPLLAPWKQIMANGGFTETDFVVEDWVRNSVKVDRVALQNASKISASLVTVGAVIAQEKVKPLEQLLRPQATEE